VATLGLMIRFAPAFALPLLLGIPLCIEPSWGVSTIAAIAGACMIDGAARSSLASTTAGGTLALIALTLALWESAASLNVFGAVAFGLTLLFSAEGVHFGNRFARAGIDKSVWRRQIAWWLERAAIAVGAAIVLAALASFVAIAFPAFGRPILAGTGALAAFAAALRLSRPREES
jgi:hypothetical protein